MNALWIFFFYEKYIEFRHYMIFKEQMSFGDEHFHNLNGSITKLVQTYPGRRESSHIAAILPANDQCWHNVVHRPRRWPNIKSASVQPPVSRHSVTPGDVCQFTVSRKTITAVMKQRLVGSFLFELICRVKGFPSGSFCMNSVLHKSVYGGNQSARRCRRNCHQGTSERAQGSLRPATVG